MPATFCIIDSEGTRGDLLVQNLQRNFPQSTIHLTNSIESAISLSNSAKVDACLVGFPISESVFSNLIAPLKHINPLQRVALYNTMACTHDDIFFSILNGVDGFLTEKHLLDNLHHIATDLLSGHFPISPSASRLLVEKIKADHLRPTSNQPELLSLTPREHEILNLLFSRSTVKEIAFDLSISKHTVNQHLRKIYQKLNVRSRYELLTKTNGGIRKATAKQLD